MSFASEVASARSASKAPVTEAAPAAPVVEASTAPAAGEITMPEHGDIFMEGLPAGVAPLDPAAIAAAEAAKPKATEPPAPISIEPKKAPIKIGSQEFQTIEDAMEYARGIEAASQADKAYIEGLREGKERTQLGTPEKVKTAEEIFAERVFEDPVAAAKEFKESIERSIKEQYNESIKIQTQQQTAAASQAAAWDNFYKTNPDLSAPETRDVLQNYLIQKFTKEGTLKPTDPEAKFAELARKHLRIVKESTLPTEELPGGPVETLPPTGVDTSGATKVKKEENVDFVTQVNNMRKRKT